MAITPADIEQLTFSPSKHGYDTEEVDNFLEQLSTEVDSMLQKIADLKGRLNTSESQLQSSQAQVAVLQQQVAEAEAEAAEANSRAAAAASAAPAPAASTSISASISAVWRITFRIICPLLLPLPGAFFISRILILRHASFRPPFSVQKAMNMVY